MPEIDCICCIVVEVVVADGMSVERLTPVHQTKSEKKKIDLEITGRKRKCPIVTILVPHLGMTTLFDRSNDTTTPTCYIFHLCHPL